jgi:hypothetical protein
MAHHYSHVERRRGGRGSASGRAQLLPPTVMKLKEIHRTSTFAWSPEASLPVLATGTVAGALDESFSNESQLEIWAPDFMDPNEFELGSQGRGVKPSGVATDTARFVGSHERVKMWALTSVMNTGSIG